MNIKIIFGVLIIVGLFIFIGARTDDSYNVSENQNVVEVKPLDDESTDEVANNKDNLIRLDSPTSGQVVGNPASVKGEARGFWFFEGSFPIVVVDWNGLIIGEGYATAQDEWMNEEFVPFTGEVNYDLPNDTPYKRGAIILQKDNPSGLPENDDALEIPILFE